MRFPNTQTKLWNQTNREGPSRVENGRFLGTLFGSFGLDMQSKFGRTALRGTVKTTDTAGNANFTNYGSNFKYFAGAVYTVAGTKVHLNSGVPSGNFTVDSATGTPTTCDSQFSDLEIFPGATPTLYVTTKSNVVYYTTDGTSWSNFTVAGSDIGPHLLCYYGSRMYFVRVGNTILSWNAARSVATLGTASTITLPGNETVSFMVAASDRIWVGTINNNYQPAHIYEWDGASPQATRSYEIEATGALSCVIKDGIPYVMDTQGRLIRWTSTGFIEVARLPLQNRYLFDATYSGSNGLDRFIHPHGMTIHNNRIVMFINNQVYENGTPIPEFCPSGVWEYDVDLGLYHRFALSYIANSDYTAITDYGQNRISTPGACVSVKILTNSSNQVGSLFISSKYFTDATTTAAGVWVNDTNNNKTNTGYIVTSEIDSSGVADMWNKAFLKFRRLLNSTDKIILKYRFTKQAPTEMTITWTSATTFTTVDANMANYAVGDEVEITRGKGGGMCSHITVIALNAGTYTVTVDETHTGATSGTASARFQKWIKAGAVESDQVSDWKDFPLGKLGTTASNSGWVQFKIFFFWKGDNEFDYIDVVNVPYKKAE